MTKFKVLRYDTTAGFEEGLHKQFEHGYVLSSWHIRHDTIIAVFTSRAVLIASATSVLEEIKKLLREKVL